MPDWLLLHYRVPPKPTARRVYVWRKLKRLGAILLHDAVWVLPDTPRTREQFQWLVSEIVEMTGEAQVWEARHVLGGQEPALVQQFVEQSGAAYRAILAELDHKERDLAALSQRFQQAGQQEYFKTDLGRRARQALVAAQRSTKK